MTEKLCVRITPGSEDHCVLSPFLTGRTFSSPNILRTVRRTIIRFLIELRRTFSSQNMVWTARRTILRFSTGLYCDASFDPNLRQKRSRQHDPKRRLKSSQYNHPPNYYIILGPRDKAAPPTSQQIGQFPPKRVKYRHRHPFLFLFLPHPQESSLCSQPIRDKVRRTGQIFPEHAERSLDPKNSFEIGSRNKSSPN